MGETKRLLSKRKKKRESLKPENEPVLDYFSENQTRRFESLFQQFDRNKDGEVSPKELRRALRNMNIDVDIETARSMIRYYSSTEVLTPEIFLRIVTEIFRDGYLDAKQYGIELEKTESCNANKEEELKKIFDEVDLDSSGEISKEELRSLFAKFKDVGISEEELEVVIAKADTDEDGYISFAEFKEFFKDY